MALLIAMGSVWTFNAFSSYACAPPNADHCYGLVFGHPAAVSGLGVTLSPACLYVPSGNFITDEIWLADASSPPNFVEVGFIDNNGIPINGIPTSGRYGFWGDQRPGHLYAGHVLESDLPLYATGLSIQESGYQQFTVAFASHTGVSTSNSMTPRTPEYGSETTSNTGASYSTGTGVQYRNGSWYNGVVSPTYLIQAPQTFTWITATTSYHAGDPC